MDRKGSKGPSCAGLTFKTKTGKLHALLQRILSCLCTESFRSGRWKHSTGVPRSPVNALIPESGLFSP
jgi:hypothetical protein